MRGIDSIANAVTPRDAEALDPFLVGQRLEKADRGPGRSRSLPTSSSLGLRTLATRSAAQGRRSRRPPRVNASSVNEAASPGARLDDHLDPGCELRRRASGHERDSPLARAVSFGTPTLMERELYFARRERGQGLEHSSPVGSLAALSSAIEARDPTRNGHSSRVTVFAQAMARGLGLDKERMSVLRLGALLHDVGKLAVPSSVLLKRGPLSEEELGQMRRHPAAGARMLRSLGAPATILPLVLHHHERWDGAGYPTGRRGDDIPLEARVLCIVDSFDAMTSTRPYRRARRPDEAWTSSALRRHAVRPRPRRGVRAAWAEAGLGVLVWQHSRRELIAYWTLYSAITRRRYARSVRIAAVVIVALAVAGLAQGATSVTRVKVFEIRIDGKGRRALLDNPTSIRTSTTSRGTASTSSSSTRAGFPTGCTSPTSTAHMQANRERRGRHHRARVFARRPQGGIPGVAVRRLRRPGTVLADLGREHGRHRFTCVLQTRRSSRASLPTPGSSPTSAGTCTTRRPAC